MSRKSMLNVDRILIEMLAIGASQTQAARVAGCTRRTVHRRLRNPDFVDEIFQIRAALRNAAAQKLISNMDTSRNNLQQLMQLRGKQDRNFKRYLKELAERISLMPDMP